MFDDRQPESRSARGPSATGLPLKERQKDTGDVLLRNARTGILDSQMECRFGLRRTIDEGEANCELHIAKIGELQRIRQQVAVNSKHIRSRPPQ